MIFSLVCRFPIGNLVATASALGSLTQEDIQLALRRHVAADWGDLDAEDIAANNRALIVGGRLFSAYHSPAGTKFWIITEADRCATTVLLPEDY